MEHVQNSMIDWVKMKTIDEAAQNWLEGSIRAYLHGKNSLNWIRGITRGLNSREIKEVVDSIENTNLILKNNLLSEIGYD